MLAAKLDVIRTARPHDTKSRRLVCVPTRARLVPIMVDEVNTFEYLI